MPGRGSDTRRIKTRGARCLCQPVCAVLAATLLSGLLPGVAGAQEAEEPLPRWSLDSEAGASVFFGASDQTTVATKVKLTRTSALFQVENDLTYLYGEASDGEGVTFVNKRSWSVGSTLDYRGFSWLNPYGFGSVSSSLEKKIERRYKGGGGAKFTALESDVSTLDFALAVLAEKTIQSSPTDGESQVLARWAGEFGFRRTFSEERVVFETTGQYNPVFDQFANYTVEAGSSLAFKLSEIISLKLSVEDNYDSRAKARGAASNNDGRVLFSVLSSF